MSAASSGAAAVDRLDRGERPRQVAGEGVPGGELVRGVEAAAAGIGGILEDPGQLAHRRARQAAPEMLDVAPDLGLPGEADRVGGAWARETPAPPGCSRGAKGAGGFLPVARRSTRRTGSIARQVSLSSTARCRASSSAP